MLPQINTIATGLHMVTVSRLMLFNPTTMTVSSLEKGSSAPSVEFQDNGNGGYDFYTADGGAYAGCCDSNKKDTPFQISCYDIPFIFYGATEQYVCFSYVCES
jgi:hypothetical protein